MKDTHSVYAQVDEFGYVIAINSDAFVTDLADWLKIDEGRGDRYHHAQNHYFDNPIMTDLGAYRYKLEGGYVVEVSQEEIARQEQENPETARHTLEDRVYDLETSTADMAEALEMILSGVTE